MTIQGRVALLDVDTRANGYGLVIICRRGPHVHRRRLALIPVEAPAYEKAAAH